MTLADRIADALVEQGPLPVCVIATTVRKQKAEVIAALNGEPNRFIHNGLKARASRWAVRGISMDELTWSPDYDEGEEALVTLVSQKLRTPEEALLLVVRAINGGAA